MAELATATPAAPDPIQAGIAAGVNPSGDPTKQLSIRDAWAATVEKHGPVEYEEKVDKEPPAEVAAEAKPEAEAKEEAPEPKRAPKKAAKVEAEAATEEDDEEPEGRPKTAKEHIQERREARERYQRREAEQTRRFQQTERALQEHAGKIDNARKQLEPLIRASAAIEAGDLDGFAKLLGEFQGNPEVKGWNELNSEALKAVQSPLYKKMRDLERQREEDARERTQQLAEQRQQLEHQDKQRAVAAHKQGIISELTDDEDPAIHSAIAARPGIVEAIFAIQDAEFQERGAVPTPREAAVKFLKNVRNDFQFWSDFFSEHGESDIIKALAGSQPAPKKKAAVSDGRQRTETSERRTPALKPAPKNVPQSQTAQAAALGALSEKELKRITAIQMEQDFARIR